jgi:acyl-CoA reductase-like NAD-dependent aldehyde dehydrogenase
MRVLRPLRHRTRLRTTAVERYEPRGVVGLVPDPAAPFDPATATAALVAGNAVVILPELRCGFTALFLTQLFGASRLPADLVQVVPGRPGLAAAAAAAVDQLVAGADAADRLRDACSGHGTTLASGPRTDPLDFTTATVVRR